MGVFYKANEYAAMNPKGVPRGSGASTSGCVDIPLVRGDCVNIPLVRGDCGSGVCIPLVRSGY